jgi:diguanylate cyclase (GGDEF)-like protein
MKLYHALLHMFPDSFRGKVVVVMLLGTLVPVLLLIVWLLANNGEPARHLIFATFFGLACAVVGTLLSLALVYRMLGQLRQALDALDAYYTDQILPQLPVDGDDDMSRLLHGIQRCLHGVDAARRELERHALEDALTGAMNRRGCEQALQKSADHANATDGPFVICVVDLDNLKQINDQHGHRAGDLALASVVESARTCCLDNGDWICRWGGDEFVLALHADYQIAQDRIRAWINVLLRPSDDSIPVLISAGCACYQAGQSAIDLYRQADSAMYQAKFSGGGRLVTYEALRDMQQAQIA